MEQENINVQDVQQDNFEKDIESIPNDPITPANSTPVQVPSASLNQDIKLEQEQNVNDPAITSKNDLLIKRANAEQENKDYEKQNGWRMGLIGRATYIAQNIAWKIKEMFTFDKDERDRLRLEHDIARFEMRTRFVTEFHNRKELGGLINLGIANRYNVEQNYGKTGKNDPIKTDIDSPDIKKTQEQDKQKDPIQQQGQENQPSKDNPANPQLTDPDINPFYFKNQIEGKSPGFDEQLIAYLQKNLGIDNITIERSTNKYQEPQMDISISGHTYIANVAKSGVVQFRPDTKDPNCSQKSWDACHVIAKAVERFSSREYKFEQDGKETKSQDIDAGRIGIVPTKETIEAMLSEQEKLNLRINSEQIKITRTDSQVKIHFDHEYNTKNLTIDITEENKDIINSVIAEQIHSTLLEHLKENKDIVQQMETIREKSQRSATEEPVVQPAGEPAKPEPITNEDVPAPDKPEEPIPNIPESTETQEDNTKDAADEPATHPEGESQEIGDQDTKDVSDDAKSTDIVEEDIEEDYER